MSQSRVPRTPDGIAAALQGGRRMEFYRELGQAPIDQVEQVLIRWWCEAEMDFVTRTMLSARGCLMGIQAQRSGHRPARWAAAGQAVTQDGDPARPGPQRCRSTAQGVTEGAGGGTAVVSLGAWLSNTKARRAKLSPEQLRQLEALGVAW